MSYKYPPPFLAPTVCGGIDAMEEEFFSKCHAFDVKTGKWREYHPLLEPRLRYIVLDCSQLNVN